jgi:hypothetical protein
MSPYMSSPIVERNPFMTAESTLTEDDHLLEQIGDIASLGASKRVLPGVLAVIGVAFLLWQAFTILPWLAAGPHQVTAFQDKHEASWWAARIYEGLAVLAAVAIGGYVIRGCAKARQLTFDAQLCISGLLAFWLDPAVNYLQPTWYYSSNWVNLNAWLIHMPGELDPAVKNMPEPIVFIGVVYTFGLLGAAILANAAMRWVQGRRPEVSPLVLIGTAALTGALIDIALELPMYHLGLWAFPGAPRSIGILGSGGQRFPIVEIAMACLVFGAMGAIRYFADGRGRRMTQSGTPGKKSATVVSTLALIGFTSSMVFVGDLGVVVSGLYANPYPTVSRDLQNGMCGPGTAYGPCPGSPGYSIVIKK